MNFADFQRFREKVLREQHDVLDCAATNLYAALVRLIPPVTPVPEHTVHRCHLATEWGHHFGFSLETSRLALVSCGVRDSLSRFFSYYKRTNACLWLPADNYPVYGELARAAGLTGLDVSRPMLEQARRKSAAEGLNIEWVEQDCREISLPRKFGLVFSATNAMQHLLDLESVCAFLQSAGRILHPGGQLILDVFNPNPTKLGRTSAERYLHKTITTPDAKSIRVEVASEYRAEMQILHFDLFYLSDGQLIRTKQVNMRCFFPEELLTLCKLNGLEVVKRFGNYDESAFCSISPKQILVCR